ncbi:MAG: hypothetical protein ACLT2T_08410 [Bilophila wadsworthia]
MPLFMAAYLFWLDWRMALRRWPRSRWGCFAGMAMTKDYAERYATVQTRGRA